MSINYYCSGFNLEEGFSSELAQRLNEDIKGTKSIVFVPGSVKPEKLHKAINVYMPGLLSFFEKAGITFEEQHLITPDMESTKAQELMKESDFIFLMGGNPFLQMDLVKEKGLDSIIKDYNNVIMGMSAGAMIMSEYTIITPCSEEYPDFDIREGLKLDKLSIYPHMNFADEMPEKLDLKGEIIARNDLFVVAKQYGNFYLLQDDPTVSLIRTEEGRMEFIGGTAFEVNQTEIKKVHENRIKKLK